ncbi:MAG: MBL fold metallo-hydrolase, partial [Lachnospiraceae bacterium]|nr:MBL fold metallo-hydrolase [Lachnospiraceae bacterium]
MEIKAVKFRKDGFYSQPMVFGGEEGMDKFDAKVKYRGSLQNYLIDTGDEVILVDTGLPAETPVEVPDENAPAFLGKEISSYMDAFSALGYKPEQVTKILLTHKHPDHSAALEYFQNAKVFVYPQDADALKLSGENIVRVTYKDGP